MSEDRDVFCKSLSLVSLGKYQPLFKHGQSIIRDLGMCDLKSLIYQTKQTTILILQNLWFFR